MRSQGRYSADELLKIEAHQEMLKSLKDPYL